MNNSEKIEILKEIINGNLGNARAMCEQFERGKLRNDINSVYIKYINELIAKEFKEFKEDVLACWSRSEMFDRAYEIQTKTEISGFFKNCDLTDEQYRILTHAKAKTTTDLIDVLYDYYLDCDVACICTYSDIEEWIGWFCEKEKELEENGKN